MYFTHDEESTPTHKAAETRSSLAHPESAVDFKVIEKQIDNYYKDIDLNDELKQAAGVIIDFEIDQFIVLIKTACPITIKCFTKALDKKKVDLYVFLFENVLLENIDSTHFLLKYEEWMNSSLTLPVS